MRGKHPHEESTDCQMESNGQDATPSASNVILGTETLKTDFVEREMRNETTDLEVIFRNIDCAKKYKSGIECYLKDLLANGDTFAISCEFAHTDELQFGNERFCVDKVSEENKEENFSINKVFEGSESFCIDKVFEGSESFCIDKGSQSSTPRTPSYRDRPIYTSPFTELLECKSEEIKDTKEKKRTPARTCFNCLGCHHLKDCPKKHNAQRITSNRNQFFMDSPQTTVRYHQDDSFSFDGGKIRPGIISDRLRDALNLRRNQLPPYIYKMRLLGYPPGWLEDAEVQSSGITLFDSETRAEKSTAPEIPVQYDGTKFIKYPGFNCPVPEGMIDEWKQLRMPPMQSHQMLTEALKHNLVTMSSSTDYTKKKPSEKPKTDAKNKRSKNDPSVDQPRKKKVSSKNEKSSKAEDLEDGQLSDSIDDKALGLTDRKSLVLTDGKAVDLSDDSAARCSSNSAKPQVAVSISVEPGVPVIDTPNPFKGLPTSEKFSAGITDHMNFENLPDAVGKFNQMRSLLGEVRQKLSQKEN